MSRTSRTRGCLLVFTCVCLVTLAVLTPIFLINNRPPTVSIPTPMVPKPNGWDDFVTAGKMIRNIGHQGPYSEYPETKWTPDRLRAFVDANKPALDILRRGLSKPYLHPPISNAHVAEETFAAYPLIRESARTLAGEAQYYTAIGQHEKAADCLLDGIDLGVTLPGGGSFLTGLVGRWIEQFGTDTFTPVVPKLDENALARVADRLEKIQKKRLPYSEIVLEDGRVDTALYVEAFQSPQHRKGLANPINWFLLKRLNAARDRITPEDIWFNARFTFANKKSAVREFEKYYVALAREQRGHYTGKSSVPEPNNIILGNVPRGQMARRRSPFTLNEAVFALVQAEVGLRRYQKAQGRYPANLLQLVPHHLQSVPVDPFGQGKSLKYRALDGGKSYLLYSLGPNLQDDKGKADPARPRWDHLDLVAGELGRQ